MSGLSRRVISHETHTRPRTDDRRFGTDVAAGLLTLLGSESGLRPVWPRVPLCAHSGQQPLVALMSGVGDKAACPHRGGDGGNRTFVQAAARKANNAAFW